ncbi:MAG: DUF4412 domain-containing protein [bacterium]
MKRIFLILLFLGLFAMIAAPSIRAGESTAQYSAVERMSTPQGNIEARVFVAPGMKRMEMKEATQILRFDKDVMWLLMPQQRMYMEKPITAAPGGSADLKYLERKKLGKETVNGISATKYRMVAQDQQGNRLEGFSWLTAEGILIKNDMKTSGDGRSMRVQTEISDLKVGKQDPALFELPRGYKKFAMPAGMPGGMPGGFPGGMKRPRR